MKPFQVVDVIEMQALLQQQDTLLLDYRNERDYQAEHIDRAVHVNDKLVPSLIRRENKNRTIVIYCYHGHSSEDLAELFTGFGFNNVYSVTGGFASWKAVHG